MSDLLLQEIDEELRQDRFRAFWKKYGTYVVVVVVLFIVSVILFRGYDSWQQSHAADDGDALVGALKTSEAQATPETQKQFEKLAAEGTRGAAVMAKFRVASDEARLDDKPKAVKSFDALSSDGSLDPQLRDLAKIRAAGLLLSADDADGAAARLKGLDDGGNAFRHSARELLALAAYQKKDLANAARLFDLIVNDPACPNDIRSRSEMMVALLEADGFSADTSKQNASPRE